MSWLSNGQRLELTLKGKEGHYFIWKRYITRAICQEDLSPILHMLHFSKSISPLLLVALLHCMPSAAWFRVACSTTPVVQGAFRCFSSTNIRFYIKSTERVDPIVSPGISPSNHVHVCALNIVNHSLLTLRLIVDCTWIE